MYKVAVLMSSYNGENYIKEQIESVLGQNGVDVTLYIRDDGSSDKTIDIIKSYSDVNLITGNNLGLGRSFMELVYNVRDDYDYYAFADQDDHWLPDKLIEAIRVISRCDIRNFKQGKVIDESELESVGYVTTEYPVMYASNLYLVDSDLNVFGEYFAEKPELNIVSSIFGNSICGCTMVFNKELLNVVRTIGKPDDKILIKKNHDAWMLYCAYMSGMVVYDNNSYIYYRQHSANVVGGIHLRGIKLLKHRIKSLFERKGSGIISSVSRELLTKFDNRDNDEELINKLCTISTLNKLSSFISLIRDKEFRRETGVGALNLIIYWVFRWY